MNHIERRFPVSKGKYTILAALIALWVTVFIFVESSIGKLCGLESVEFWPALMGPGLIGLLGGEAKKAEKTFYITAAFGILAALAFVELEHFLVPLLGARPGVLTALFVVVFAVIACQFFLPQISGPISFIYFNAATVLTHDIMALTIARLVILFVGTFVFYKVEHVLIALVSGKKKH